MRFDEHFLKASLPDAIILAHTFPISISCSIDTRSLVPGDLFFALQGAHVDGHHFIQQAFDKGASGVVLSAHKRQYIDQLPTSVYQDKLVVLVADPVHALIRMATMWRSQFSYPVVAITGSIGKTSTKEMLAHVLTAAGKQCCVSKGNQNTRIGLALNIFNMRANHHAAVFELGVSRRGEMAQMVDVLRPTTAVITAVGHSHMEGLGSLADIAQEKRDVFKCFTEESIGIVNGDQAVLAQVGYKHPVVKFGTKTMNQVQARKIRVGNNQVSFVLKLYKQKIPLILQGTNEGRVFNSLAAAAVAYVLGISEESIMQGLQQPIVVSGRFETRSLARGKGVLINDCYNASPESMKAALLALEHLDTNAQKIAVLGDMLELGVNSPFWHRQLGRFLRKAPSLKKVVLVGEMVKWTQKTIPLGVQIELVSSWHEAVTKLEQLVGQESVVLVKGSHGMKLSNVVEHFAPQQHQL